ncbi:alpha/beta hydrolase [Nocardia jinanensis]|uniref:Esterase n=1 Tax=Nocardia jinanensis TaxID=382504 RepID=A0A917VXI3_9NOCA|nr:alpha/beta hydrolase [Nocardia jinanensis]GGL29339.1 esterase [Nocardia jinanensis]
MRDIALPLPLARAILGPMYRVSLHSRLPWRVQRALIDAGSALQPVPPGVRVERIRLGDRPAERLAPSTPAPAVPAAVLYLHGGGYAVGSLATHRSLNGRLAAETGLPVYAVDYRLAPEHPYPAALDDAEAAFRELVTEHGYRPERIAIAGDSAGGGLALALAQRLIARHGYTPAALGLIAPWADPNELAERPRDLVVNGPWSRACAAAYLGAGDPADPGYAPLHGVLAGLPPVYIQADVDELLHPQCVGLAAALRDAGVEVSFTESRGLWHVAQLQAALVGRAAAVLTEMAGFLRQAVDQLPLRDLG